MQKRSRVRYPVHRLLSMKQETDDILVKIAELTDEPIAEVMRRALEKQLPVFLTHASTTGKLLNGEVK